MSIARHMEVTIMQADKEEQEQQATEDFWKIEQYSKEFCETQEQLWMNGYSASASNYRRGIHVAKDYKVVSIKDPRNIGEYFMTSCNNKSNWG